MSGQSLRLVARKRLTIVLQSRSLNIEVNGSYCPGHLADVCGECGLIWRFEVDQYKT